MKRFADLFERRRAWVGAFAALVSLVALLGSSRVKIDDIPSSIFRSNDEHYARLEQVFEDFGTDDADCLLLLEGDDLISPEGVARLRALDRELGKIEGITQVISLDDLVVFDEGVLFPRSLLPPSDAPPEAFQRARAEIQEHPLAGDLLLSADGRAAVIVARLAGAHLPISAMREQVTAMREVSARVLAGSDIVARLTGVPVLRVIIFEAIGREQMIFPPLAALIGILLGLFIFRRVGPVLLTLLASGTAALWALGFMGLVGQPINIFTAQLPLLVMVIAYTDAIHLMIDTLRGRRAGLGPVQAASKSIRDLGLPCALTSLTTAIGFGSLVISRVEVIQRFGGVFAAAVAMSFVVVLTVIPFGTSLFLRDSRRPSLSTRFSRMHVPAERLIRAVLRRPRTVAFAGLGLTGFLLVLALQLVPENTLTETTPKGLDATDALAVLEERFGGALSASVLVEWPAERPWHDESIQTVLTEVTRVLEESPFTHAPRSALDLLELLPPGMRKPEAVGALPAELVGRFLRADLGRALVSARVPDESSAVCDPAYAALEEELARIRAAHPGVDLNLTGTGYIARRNVNLIIRDFALGLGLAALVIFLVLGVAFRSWRLGALSLLPNAFPIVVAAAGLRIAGLELQISSVLAFTVLLGIAVDDTIHLVCRYQRERAEGHGVDEALVRAFLGVGRALVITTVVLAGGFGVTLFSSLPTSALFALIVITGLIAALLGDLILLPATIKAFGGGKAPTD